MLLTRYRFRAMGCPCEIRLYPEPGVGVDDVARAALSEVWRLEQKYTRYREDSLTTAINRSAGDPRGIEVDKETAGLLDYADVSYRESEGLFDITSGVLRQIWDFKKKRIPTPRELDAVRSRIGWHRVRWERARLVLPARGMELDFGGYVKEYAADCVAELCRREGIRFGLIDLGGDLRAVGPHPDGEPWIVGIRHPRKPGAAMATIPLMHGALASSGDYERFMVVDGRRYGHILNPKTGWPVEGLLSVSVAARQCLVAGTAATIAMLKGGEGSLWLDRLGLPSLRMTRDDEIEGTLARGKGRVSGAWRARCESSVHRDPGP